jgi:hypothetical protein
MRTCDAPLAFAGDGSIVDWWSTLRSRIARLAMSDLTHRIAALSPHALQQLADRLLARRPGAAVRRIRKRARPGAPIPMSYAQESLWLADRLGTLGAAYNESVRLRMAGVLDVGALDRAFNELARRHESLRTRFGTAADGQGVQVIDEGATFRLQLIDLEHLATSERDARIEERIRDATTELFDLTTGPLWRVVVLRLAERDHVLILTTHHIISDLWTLSLLIRQLEALYTAYVRGVPPDLPEPDIQYADYAIWQRDWLRSERLERGLTYWRQQLAGMPAKLDLPTDRPRDAVPSHRGARVSFSLPAALSAAIIELSRREGVTLYMLLLVAFQALLARWSGQRDIVVGSPIAGRTERETENVVGLFVNTLVMRTSMTDDPPFRVLLGRVREVALQAYAYQDLPFEKLVADLKVVRDPSRQALFQVMFMLQSYPWAALEWPEIRLTPLPGGHWTSKFDLTLEVFEGADELIGRMEYATDLFERSTIERLVNGLQALLESAIAKPEQRVSELPILGPVELDDMMHEWNAPLEDCETPPVLLGERRD